MDILLTIVVYLVAMLLATVVFAASLFLIESEKESSFVVDGNLITWGKCAGIALAMTVLGFLPYGGWLTLIAFFAAVIVLFQKSFVQALLLLIIYAIFSRGLIWAISSVLGAMLSSG